jgi:aminoglycoside phosphotransferase (APT) family kinase protein
MLTDERKQALERYLTEQQVLAEPSRIVASSRMAMGQSRAMYRLDVAPVSDPQASRALVLRIEQWGLLGTDSRDEVRIMRALHDVGYPVANVLAYEPGDALLGQPFFLMEFVEGSSVFVRESLDEYVRTLDQLHRMNAEDCGLGFLPRPEGTRDSALDQVERWYDVYRWGMVGEPSPLVEECAQWLRNNAPESERVGIVHGDPGPGNFLHRDGRLASVVDWEFAHLGDPDEDWAYLISMRGVGVMSEDDWVTYLHDLVGVDLDRDRLEYWKAVNFFKGVCIDQTALKTYIDGTNLAPNMLAIGTAIHLSALRRLADAVL